MKADWEQLRWLLDRLEAGDAVTVRQIDRLTRATFDPFAIIKYIADAGGQFKPLAESWTDTATSTDRLLIAVLGELADVEHAPTRTRTAERSSQATTRGQHISTLTPQQC